LADVTVVVLVPGLGDDVQAIKAGIMEVADVFAINKSDLPGAERLEQEIRAMQSLGTEVERDNAAPIRRVIAAEGSGVEDLMEVIETVFGKRQRKSARAEIWSVRLRELLRDRLLSSIPEEDLELHAQRVATKLEDPYVAVDALRKAMLG
jgi:LAO/AO transport system kinase